MRLKNSKLFAALSKNRAEIALSVGSILFVYLLLELIGIPLLLRDASLDRQSNFPGIMRVMAQSSKEGLRPHNYILLVGDSYAEGLGDWLLDSDATTNAAHGSANVIHKLTGRDVISFGRGGAGSVEALGEFPRRRQSGMKRFFVGPPDTVLVYFYEGNDLDNNVRFIQKHLSTVEDPVATFGRYIRWHVEMPAAARGYIENLYLPNYLWKLIKSAWKKVTRTETDPAAALGFNAEAGNTNVFEVAGNEVRPPDGLQSPSLDLTETELDEGLAILERSLESLKEYYPDADIHVVYLPSPLTSYHIASSTVSAQVYIAKRAGIYPSDAVQERSQLIRQRVHAIANKLDLGFLDFTPAVRERTKTSVIHGPRDWKHYNREGYTLLGEEIANYLSAYTGGHEDTPESGH